MARVVLRLAGGGAEGAAGGVALPRLPARGHGRRGARLPRRGRCRGRADRARDADAERRRRAAPLRLEPLQLGLPRARPLAPDRAGLSLVAHPRAQRGRRPAAAADREGDRAARSSCATTGLHAPAHGALHAGRQHRDQHARRPPTATAPAASRSSTRARSRSRAAGRTAARGRALNYDFWYQPRKNVLVSSEFGEPNAYEPGFDIEDVGAGRYGQRLHFWDLAERRLEQTLDLGEAGLVPLEVRWLHDPEAEQGFVGATLSSNILRFHRSNGSFRAEPVIEVENEELEGWPLPGGVPGLITDIVALDGRPLPLLLQLAARRPAPIRRLRPRQPEADRPALARRAARQAQRRRPRAERRAADDPALARRPPALRHQLALLDLGQPVLPRAALVAAARELHPDGGMELDPDFFVDLNERPGGPARAHEVRLQGGDCTTEIFQ